jgi:hypothetical protein
MGSILNAGIIYLKFGESVDDCRTSLQSIQKFQIFPELNR